MGAYSTNFLDYTKWVLMVDAVCVPIILAILWRIERKKGK